MSGAPPGYNPSDSLLSGGTSAQIHPVMGGGGAMPEGHNAGVSLLQGGEGAQIHPVMGGGAPGDAAAAAATAAALAAAAEIGASAAVAAAVTTPTPLPPIPFDQLPNRIKSVENELAALQATVASPSLSAEHKKEYQLQLENKRAELAKLKGIQDDEIQRREKEKARIDLNKLKGTESWVEIYKLEVDPTKVLTQPIYKEEEMNIANRTSAEFKELVANYSTAQKEVWVKKLIDKTGGTGSTADIATSTGSRCLAVDIETVTQARASLAFDRLVHILPETTQVLLIAPPIQGNIALFDTVVDRLVKYGYLTQTIDGNMALKENCELVFSAPIFGLGEDEEDDVAKNNSLIWYSILRLKLLAKGRVTALSDYRDATEKIGCFLHQRLQTSGPFGSPQVPAKEEISNLLEPSYLVYPFSRGEKDGVLVTAALNGEAPLPMPKEGAKTYSVGQALKMPNFTDAYIAIRPDLGKPDSEFGNYVTFSSFGAGDTVADMGGFKPQKSTRGDCQDLIYLQRLEKMQPETRLGPLTGMGATLDGKFPLTIIRLRPDPRGLTGFEPSCARLGDSLRTVSLARLERFVPSPMEVPRDQAFTMINLGPKVYELRLLPPGSLDWQQMRFTDSEAEFLNDLNLRPWILSDVFPIQSLGARDGRSSRDWRNWVSQFLKAVTNSQCFKDSNLLSRRECEDARIFINAVYDYFLLNDDRLAAAFNTEDEALQNAEMFLRETRTRAELDRLEQANKQAALVRKQEDADPSIGEPETIADMEEGAFTRKKMWGDAQPDPEPYEGGPGGKDYWTLPLLIVNRRTGVYQLRALRVDKRDGESATAAAPRLNELGAQLKVKYPGWNFFY